MNPPYGEVYFYPATIRAKRLTIRPMTMRDVHDIYAYSRDEIVAKHVLWSAHASLGETRGYVRSMIRRYRSCDPSSFAIEYNENHAVIGTIGFMSYKREHNSVEVGYSLAREYWNRGIMTEAVEAMINYGFEKLKLNRIEAQHEVDNPASGAVMRNAGMLYEGRLRQRLWNKGKFVDVELYAILSTDPRRVE